MSGPGDPIRVLLVDDSAVIRGALGRIVDAQPDMVVATTAPNGKVALDALRHCAVDIVLLDVEMPEMDGLEALPLMLAQYPDLRVIMASSLTQRGAEVTMQALALGAADFIAKPAAKAGSATLTALTEEIATKIRAIAGASPARRAAPSGSAESARPVALNPAAGSPPIRKALLAAKTGAAEPRILAIAASTGGPNALATMLAGLPKDFALPILITQHMPAVFTVLLAQRLERDTGRPCREATDGEFLELNHTYVAPGESHMTVQTLEGKPHIRLTKGAPENFCRPSADPMLRSIAAVYGSSTLAVVLTGMGDDGMRGCADVRARGGCVLVQDEATSVVWGMPGSVVRAGLQSAVLPLQALAPVILSKVLAVAA